MARSSLLTLVLCAAIIFFSCKNNDQGATYSMNSATVEGPSPSLPVIPTENQTYNPDTVIVYTAEELTKYIRSERVIQLLDNEYRLASTLLIDGIKNLKIVGGSSTKLMIDDQNSTVLKLLNSNNIHLDSLVIGHQKSRGHVGEHGVLNIEQSNDINISNCKLLGAGTFGLTTFDVIQLRFINSEITACTFLIFELKKSRQLEFIDSKFPNNELTVSVLGAFTASTKEVDFLDCEFLDNKPKMTGNPAFNFMDNLENYDEPILFENCTFRNNKGFKWYGEQIELKDCKLDSMDFIF